MVAEVAATAACKEREGEKEPGRKEQVREALVFISSQRGDTWSGAERRSVVTSHREQTHREDRK